MNSLSMKKNNVSRGFVSFLSFIFIASILTQVLAATGHMSPHRPPSVLPEPRRQRSTHST
jgi:hypothetical protein